jgi:hypothetical protein
MRAAAAARQRRPLLPPDDAPYSARDHLDSAAMSDNELVKRLAWSGMVAGIGALASIVTTRVAALIFRRVFGEDPPE